jgi:hypothetical protein
MEPRAEICASCGASKDPATGVCRRCEPNPQDAASVAAESATSPRVSPPPLPPAARPPASSRLGAAPQTAPAEFEAEECLARGQAERALVIASHALKERPDNLTLLALVERARKAVLRGKRGERLEQRVHEARNLVERGLYDAGERIVVSALKLIPNHPGALTLFGELKARRLAAPTPEAEAERELDRLAHGQARQALSRARALRERRLDRAAFVETRRGLRAAPDEPELLALFADLQESLSRVAARHASSRKRVFQARARMEEGRYPESRVILREVLQADPQFGPAQSAMEDLEARARREPAVALPPARPVRPPESRSAQVARSQSISAARPAPTAMPRRRPLERWRLSVVVLLLLGVAVAVGVWRLAHPRSATLSPAPVIAVPAEARRSTEVDPLAILDPASQAAVRAALGAYERALETADPEALAQARPDLSLAQRQLMIASFQGAANAAVDLRVTAVTRGPDVLHVHLVRTDVIVGDALPQDRSEETIRFVLRDGAWEIG